MLSKFDQETFRRQVSQEDDETIERAYARFKTQEGRNTQEAEELLQCAEICRQEYMKKGKR